MSSLPLSFRLRHAVVEKHQVEGTDPSDRYFNRMVPVKRVDRGYTANVMYEALVTESGVHPTIGGPSGTSSADFGTWALPNCGRD